MYVPYNSMLMRHFLNFQRLNFSLRDSFFSHIHSRALNFHNFDIKSSIDVIDMIVTDWSYVTLRNCWFHFFFFIYNRNLHFTFVCHLLKFKDFFHVDSIKRQRKMKNFLCLSRHISCSLFSFKSIILLCVLHSHPFHFFHIIEIEFLLKELLSSTICTPVNQSVVKKNFYSFFLSKKCVKKFIFF